MRGAASTCWWCAALPSTPSPARRPREFAPAGNDPYGQLRRALRNDIDEEAWSSLYSTVSRPFTRPATGRIAIKVINHYGDEVLQVYYVAG